MKIKIGFIGLGLMGLPIAKNLLKAGHELYIWNRSKEKYDELQNSLAIVTETPKKLAENTDIIIMCVTDESALESILEGNNGIFSAAKKPKIIVDHSTISPIAAKSFAKKSADVGIFYIDAPVTGSVPGAINGTLVVYAGGDENKVNEIRAILSAYSIRITHMGPNGYGQATKICNQVMLHNNIISIFETINIAKKQGLDTAKLLEAFQESLFDSKAWRLFSAAAIEKSPAKIAYLKDVLKDLNYILDTAEITDCNIPLTKKTAELVKSLVEKGHGCSDVMKLMEMYV